MGRLFAYHEASAVITAIKPFGAGSCLTVAAVKPHPCPHFDKRSALRQLSRFFEFHADQCASLVILENPHRAHRDFVAGFGLPDCTPLSGSQEQGGCNDRGEHDCSDKKGLFQSLRSRATPFRPYFAASDAFCQSAFPTGPVLWGPDPSRRSSNVGGGGLAREFANDRPRFPRVVC